MFKSLFRPKWQSPKSQLRRAAIAELDLGQPDHISILRQLARSDSEPSVRKTAVSRLDDMELLEMLAQRDMEQAVRDAALDRYKELLCGHSTHSPDLQTRIERLKRISSPATLTHLILHGDHIDLKLAAIEQLDDDIYLEEIALHCPIARLRLAAVERITSSDVLQHVEEHSRGHDKSVHHVARDKLAALSSLEKQREQRHQQRLRLCDMMEMHARASWTPLYGARHEHISQEWKNLLDGDISADLSERFATASGLCLRSITEHGGSVSIADQQRARSEAEQAVQELHNGLERLQQEPDTLSPELLDALHATQGNRFREAASLTPLESALHETFQQLLHTLQSGSSALARLHKHRATIRVLTASSLSDHLLQVDLVALRQRLSWPFNDSTMPALLQELEQHIQACHERMQKSQARHEHAASTLQQLFSQLNSQMAEKQLHAADQTLVQMEKLLPQLPGAEQQHWREQLRPLQQQRDEWRDWEHFAVLRKKEALCASMEALIDETINDIDARALRVQALQNEWKQSGHLAKRDEHTLWQRFHVAAERAYAPVKTEQHSQLTQQKQLLDQRLQLLDQLQGYLAGPVAQASWQQLDEMQQIARLEWKQYSPVPARDHRRTEKLFREQLDSLHQQADQKHDAARQTKQQWLEEMQRLASQAPGIEHTQRIRQLQQQWHEATPLRKSAEHKLWQFFRKAADDYFQHRDQLLSQQRQEKQRRRDDCLNLQQQIENIAHTQELSIAQRQQQLTRLREQIHQQHLDRRDEQKLQQQLSQQLQQLEQAHMLTTLETALAHATAPADADTASAPADDQPYRQLCLHLETLAGIESPADEQEARRQLRLQQLARGLAGRDHQQGDRETLLQQWQQLPPLPATLAAPLQERFRRAFLALLNTR